VKPEQWARLRPAALGLLMFLFGALTPPYLLARSLAVTLLDPGAYYGALDRTDAARRLRPGLLRLAVTRWIAPASGSATSDQLNWLPPQAWEAMAAELLPEAWLDAQARGLVATWFAWLGGQEPLPALQIDLGPVIERLRGPRGALALVALLEGTRPCAPNEVLEGGEPWERYGAFVPCIPPNANLAALAGASATYTAQQLPASIHLPGLIGMGVLSPEIGPLLDEVRFTVRWARTLLGLWGWACLLLLLAFLLLGARHPVELAALAAAPVGLAGAISLALAGLLAAIATPAGLEGLIPVEPAWPEAGMVMQETAALLLRTAAWRLAAWGAGLVTGAALAWGIGRLARPRPAPANPVRRPGRRRLFM
jgi:hypothetical protein